VAPLRRKFRGAITPEIRWRHYGENPVAPLRRKRNGAIAAKIHNASKPFPSKALRDAFEGRSSNNAGFMVAVLRAEGLLGPAPDAETQHVITGDWAAWKKAMLAVTGTLIELPDRASDSQPTPEADRSKTPKQHPAKNA
jgi:hypothetical protein